jgi:uncharacterized protein YbjT (DUF2867 family)
MKLVVMGGTGLIGSRLVNKLRENGHHPVAASPKTDVNSLTGEGLHEALRGAQVLVDVANAPDWDDDAVMDFFQTSTRNLLAAAAAAGVGHHVALSVVGTERLTESGYFRAKITQEELIKDFIDPVLDRPRDAVLRIHERHRRRGHRRQRGQAPAGSHAAHGRR